MSTVGVNDFQVKPENINIMRKFIEEDSVALTEWTRVVHGLNGLTPLDTFTLDRMSTRENISVVVFKTLELWVERSGDNAMFSKFLETLEGAHLTRLKHILLKESHRFQRQTKDHSPLPEFWKIPRRNTNFIGRVEIMNQIDKYFSGVQIHARIAAICGFGGVGKTSTALEYVWTRRGNYNNKVYWLRAENRGQILAEYTSIGKHLNIVDHSEVKAWFEKFINHGWLLVYDNSPNYDDIVDLLPVTGGNILITSRYSIWQDGERFELERFQVWETVQYVQKLMGKQKRISIEDIYLLGAQFDNLPLAVAQACAYIKYSGISIPEYLKIYKENKQKWLGKNMLPEHHNTASVLLTWEITMKTIKEKYELAAAWLEIMAVLNCDNIPHDLLKTFLEWNNVDVNEYSDVLLDLAKFSMIKVDANGECSSLHRLLQEAIILKFDPETKEKVTYTAFFLLLSQVTPDSLLFGVIILNNLTPHWEALLSFVQQSFQSSDIIVCQTPPNRTCDVIELEISSLVNMLALFVPSNQIHMYNQKENFGNLKELIATRERVLGTDDSFTMTILHSRIQEVLLVDESVQNISALLLDFSKKYVKEFPGSIEKVIERSVLALNASFMLKVQFLSSVLSYIGTLPLFQKLDTIRSKHQVLRTWLKYTNAQGIDHTTLRSELIWVFRQSVVESLIGPAQTVLLISIEHQPTFLPHLLTTFSKLELKKRISKIITLPGTSVLHYSSLCGHIAAVKILVEYRLELNRQEHVICQHNPTKVNGILNTCEIDGYSPTPLDTLRIDNTNGSVFDILLRKRIRVRRTIDTQRISRNFLEGNPLYLAICKKNPAMVKQLLDFGVSPIWRDDHSTILHKAVRKDCEDIMILILDAIVQRYSGVDLREHLNAIDSEGDTPLMWGAELGLSTQVKILLLNGVDVNIKNYKGMTAMDWAVQNGHLDTELLLREHMNKYE